MKILLIHNTYQHKGGEDSVLENEYQLLKRNNTVEKLLFNNENIKSSFDKLKTGLNSIWNKNSAQIVKEKIKSFNPDIIHVHNFFPIASPSIFYVANALNIPIIMTLHNYRLICPNALLFKENEICEQCINKSFAIDGILNACYRDSKVQTLALSVMSYVHKKKRTWNTKIDRYITLTHFAKNKIMNSSLKLNNNQLIVKPNFVEDYGFDYEKDDYFVFVGRLSPEKGIELLLNTFQKTDKKLLIIGGGPLEHLVKRVSNINTNIKYLGYQNNNYIIKTLKKAQALIFTSIWYEGMPMTILESFSTATPIIAPNIGGSNEMIDDGVTGLIYEVNNINDLLNKISYLSKNKILLKQMSINARKEYQLKYTPNENYKLLTDIYKKAINEKIKSN